MADGQPLAIAVHLQALQKGEAEGMASLLDKKIARLEAELAQLKRGRETGLSSQRVNVLVVGSGGREHTIMETVAIKAGWRHLFWPW